MADAAETRVRRMVNGTAAIVAVLVTVLPPVGFLAVSIGGTARALETEAVFRAGQVSRLVIADPAGWMSEREGIEQLLEKDPALAAGQVNAVRTTDGTVVAQAGVLPDGPSLARVAVIYDAGVPAGHLETRRTLGNTLLVAGFVGAASLALGLAVFVPLRLIPLRALARATAALERSVARHADARRDAEQASAATSRFLAAASHDLRQPLHALTYFSASLAARATDPEICRLVDKVDTSVAVLESLFNGILDISKLDAGVVRAEPVAFAVEPLFERLRREFLPLAADRGLVLSMPTTGATVFADPVLVERMLRNLLANAIRHTTDGAVFAGCRWCRAGWRLEVRDSGPGIPAEHQARIFDEFFQIGNPERDRSRGLGLGLAIVRRIADLMGTRVCLRSCVGRGSAFGFVVPRGVRSPVDAPSVPPQGPDASLADCVLVVIDDEADIREAMGTLLGQWGCRVRTAASRDAGLAMLEASGEVPDGLIVDLRLADGASGADAVDGFRSRYGADLPCIVMTGDITPDRLRDPAQRGLVVLHKPVAPARLRALLSAGIAARKRGVAASGAGADADVPRVR
jgi:signal transduction histidine kinase